MSSNNKTILQQAFDNMYKLDKLAESSPTSVTMTRDRFKTIWSGFDDPQARAFQKIEDEAPDTLRTALNDVRLAEGSLAFINLVSDEYHRLKHAEDQLIHTGEVVAKGNWEQATRGEKLRYLSKPLLPYGDHHQRVRFVLQELETVTKDGEDDDGEPSDADSKCNMLSQKEGMTLSAMLELLRNDIKILGVLKGFFRELEKLVREERKQGWDWNDGSNKQVHIRKTIEETCNKFSKYFWTIVLDELKDKGGSDEVKRLVGEKIRGN
ncbi:uncharacterized protein RSE6_13909 [Rhynchosporium secalis]|uniref:Uncharacterized protein n=1 Tax=Rhynchosporium secalis TaxID=38038 RepID=A0A1E1MU18_RHYSE|nr:uncharacterized protein RSE6_13909 [Rhynchosporium secalis]